MTRLRDTDQLIREFLQDGLTELPDRTYDAVRSHIDHTRQRVVIGPWKEEQMSRFAMFAVSAAAVVLLAVIGIRFLPPIGGIGGQPIASPTSAPTAVPTPPPTASVAASPTPSSTPSAIADPNGQLQPGIYVAHPFDSLLGMDARAFTFEVPGRSWEAQGDPGRTVGVVWNAPSGGSSGAAVGFLKVHSLNTDACSWTTDEDFEIGPTAEDLLNVLLAASGTMADGFSNGVPYVEQIANLTGPGIELTMRSPLPRNCDEGAFRIWNAEGFDIYAQGPSNVWRLGIFDVGGERYVVMASYMPDTPDDVRNEMMGIFRSVSIASSPGCPKYSHLCN